MFDFLMSAGLMPHGYCLLWKPWLVALHAGADGLIAASYFLIPAAILSYLRKRPDVTLGPVAALFAAFILLCGLTHLVGLLTLWFPIYEVQGVVKMVTALVSAATALILFPLVPKLAALPSPFELQSANAALEAEMARHRQTLGELERTRARLEEEVAERTRELTEANERLSLVTRETVHRSKNLLTVVQSIARQTADVAETKDDLLSALSGRMSSLARALSNVMDSGSSGADLGEVISTQLEHYRDSYPGRVAIRGPSLALRAEAAQQIGLAMHELATNAVKHGALSVEGGRVEVSWRREDGDIVLGWTEHGGPPGAAEALAGGKRRGFGSVLLGRAVPMQLRGQVSSEFTEDGYRYILRVPAGELIPRGRADPDEEVARAFP